MEKIANNKILSYLDRLFITREPITADIFLTNYCNNNCQYCGYRDKITIHEAEYMKYEDFIIYANKLLTLGVQGIILTGGGEPTLNPDFDKITQWLENNNIPYGINTNFNVYKDFNPSFLKISLDGYNKETYIAKRGVDRYSQVRENIIKYRNSHPDVFIGIQCVVESIDEVDKFYGFNSDLPVNYISMRPVESCNSIYYNDIDVLAIAEIKKNIKNLHDIDSRVIYNYKWDLLKSTKNQCIGNWSNICIDQNGNVLYCCHKPTDIVGHILDDDILQKKEQYIIDFSKCDNPCRLSGMNEDINKIYEGLSNKQHFI